MSNTPPEVIGANSNLPRFEKTIQTKWGAVSIVCLPSADPRVDDDNLIYINFIGQAGEEFLPYILYIDDPDNKFQNYIAIVEKAIETAITEGVNHNLNGTQAQEFIVDGLMSSGILIDTHEREIAISSQPTLTQRINLGYRYTDLKIIRNTVFLTFSAPENTSLIIMLPDFENGIKQLEAIILTLDLEKELLKPFLMAKLREANMIFIDKKEPEVNRSFKPRIRPKSHTIIVHGDRKPTIGSRLLIKDEEKEQ